MISLTTRLKKFTTPEHLTEADGIVFWKEKVLLNILLAATLFSMAAYIPSVTLSIVEGLWPIAVIDTLMYLAIIYLFVNRKLSYQFRAVCIPAAAYVLGIILITGLGMAVVWGTVQDHDGYIDIITYPDRGTVFELYFPLCEEQPESARDTIPVDLLHGNQERILIIDDVPEQRQIAASSLEKLGYISISVESGEKAIQYLKENEADLLFLDMIMEPGIDGYETYRRILQFKPEQKAIITSGFSRSVQVTKALHLGAGQYLKKPYTIEGLGKAIKDELTKI